MAANSGRLSEFAAEGQCWLLLLLPVVVPAKDVGPSSPVTCSTPTGSSPRHPQPAGQRTREDHDGTVRASQHAYIHSDTIHALA
jgi:hypothetical protein